MDQTATLQLILPTDKRNPAFTLWEDEAQQSIHVYYGLERLAVVPQNRHHAQYKLLVANLYNAGLRVRSLEEVFGFDRKTMRRWGQALCGGDAQQLVQALEGRQAHRKLTPAIEGYVRARFGEVYRQHRANYSATLRQEIRAVFGVQLSGETLRPLLQSLRAMAEAKPQTPDSTAPAPAVTGAEASVPEAPEPPAEPPPQPEIPSPPLVAVPGPAPAAPAEPLAPLPAPCVPETPALSPARPAWEAWSPGQTRGCDHVGVLLFWNALVHLVAVLQPVEPLLKQWLASLLLGAVNVEQTKFLNWEDLGLLLGSVVRFPTPQRDALKRLATRATVQALLRWNAQQVKADQEGDFYLDPHTKHYTGMKPLLKGWCPVIRWADKALHSDFMHTVRGEPIYVECTDNFADLRQRLWGVVGRARAAVGWPADQVLTLVIDRGVFGQEVFEKVLGDPHVHLITWEKGYVAQAWQPEQKSGEFVIERSRNHGQDVRSYRFEYRDGSWSKDKRLRQFIVRATNPDGHTIQVAVLTDDRERLAVEVLRLIFNRWLQENDFKYLEKHFGINQITTYRTVAYAELAGQVEDRQVRSGQAKALGQQRQQWRRDQQRLLFAQEQADHQQQRRHKLQEELTQRLAALAPEATPERPEWTRQLARLQAAEQRYTDQRAERRAKIETLNQQLETNRQEQQTVAREESRLQQLMDQGMQRLDTPSKQLMDVLKITARNLFVQALRPFKKAYDNYRDDHDYFRKLTQCHGVLRWTGQTMEVYFLPQVQYAPSLRKIIQALLDQINATAPLLPDGSQRPLRFLLARREDFEIRLRAD